MGRELPWFDVVPLNKRTHETVTVARMIFGRGPVNFALRVAFAVWLMPYFAAAALVMILIWPALYPPVGAPIHETIARVIAAL